MARCRVWAALLGALASLATAGSPETAFQEPQQIHIGYGYRPSEMTVHWTTIQAVGQEHRVVYNPGETFVMYGAQPDALTEVVHGEHFLFRDFGSEKRNYTMHMATLKGLQPSEHYYYIVGGNRSGWSRPFRFRAGPESGPEIAARLPMQYAIYGDQGDYNGQTIPSLQAEARKGTLDVVVHIGDMAYNLDSDNGRNGDSWMRDIEPLAATVPYMVCHGNHEGDEHFNHYTQRFRNMPSNSGTLSFPEFGIVPNNWWYSWDSGLVHFVMVSTEIPFFFEPPLAEQFLAMQDAFLRKDLAAVDRRRTPWVVVGGHRPLYCSSGRDCHEAATTNRMGLPTGQGGFEYGLEAIFYEFGVDLYVCGHEHSYERLWDVAPAWNPSVPWRSGKTTRSTVDPPATTYIVTGSAGNVESHSAFEEPGQWSAVRMNIYGWSRMQVFNATHILWQQVNTDSGRPREEWGTVQDETWVIQNHHGPFAQHPRRNVTSYGPDAPLAQDQVTQDKRLDGNYAHPYEAAQCRDDARAGGGLVCGDSQLAAEMERAGRWQFAKRGGFAAQDPTAAYV